MVVKEMGAKFYRETEYLCEKVDRSTFLLWYSTYANAIRILTFWRSNDVSS